MGDLTEEDLKSEEYKKQERIKKEREKAAKAVFESEKKGDGVTLALLDPSAAPKIKGYTRGAEAMRQSSERLANWSALLATVGILLDFLTRITDVRGLGMAGATMIGTIGAIGFGMIGVALFLAVFSTGAAIVVHKKAQAEVSHALKVAVVTLVVAGIYELVWFFVSRPG